MTSQRSPAVLCFQPVQSRLRVRVSSSLLNNGRANLCRVSGRRNRADEGLPAVKWPRIKLWQQRAAAEVALGGAACLGESDPEPIKTRRRRLPLEGRKEVFQKVDQGVSDTAVGTILASMSQRYA
jgi:hypothetical protein